MADFEKLADGRFRVNVGHCEVTICKLYGPTIFADLKVKPDPESGWWIVWRNGVEWCRIPGQLDSDFTLELDDLAAAAKVLHTAIRDNVSTTQPMADLSIAAYAFGESQMDTEHRTRPSRGEVMSKEPKIYLRGKLLDASQVMVRCALECFAHEGDVELTPELSALVEAAKEYAKQERRAPFDYNKWCVARNDLAKASVAFGARHD